MTAEERKTCLPPRRINHMLRQSGGVAATGVDKQRCARHLPVVRQAHRAHRGISTASLCRHKHWRRHSRRASAIASACQRAYTPACTYQQQWRYHRRHQRGGGNQALSPTQSCRVCKLTLSRAREHVGIAYKPPACCTDNDTRPLAAPHLWANTAPSPYR